MSIEIRCQKCAKRYKVADKYAGKRIKCPGCGAGVPVPDPSLADGLVALEEAGEEPLGSLLDESLGDLLNPGLTAGPKLDLPQAPAPAAGPSPGGPMPTGHVAGSPFGAPQAAGAAATSPGQAAAQPGLMGRFLRRHWLLVLVQVTGLGFLFVMGSAGWYRTGASVFFVGLVIIGIGFIPRSEPIETVIAKILGGLLVFLIIAEVAVSGALIFSKGAPPQAYVLFLVFALIRIGVGGGLVVLYFWLCAHYGFYRTLAWTYVVLLGAIPVGTQVYLSLPEGPDTMRADREAGRPDSPMPSFPSLPTTRPPSRPSNPSADSRRPPPNPRSRFDVPVMVHAASPSHFPPHPTLRPLEPGVEFAEIRLGVPDGKPGQADRLWIYMPPGEHGMHSLSCVFMAPAGSNLLSGVRLSEADRAEHIPFVKAGFAVVAYEIDGAVANPAKASDAELRWAFEQYAAAMGGLVNAANAMTYARLNLREIGLFRNYVVGHGTAGTLALMSAAEEHQIDACVAFAPVSNLQEHFAGKLGALEKAVPGVTDYVNHLSPHVCINEFNCPLFLFHAEDDPVVSQGQSLTFATELRKAGKEVALNMVPSGGHHDAVLSEGIPAAIAWLRSLEGPKPEVATSSSDDSPPRPRPGLSPSQQAMFDMMLQHRPGTTPRPQPVDEAFQKASRAYARQRMVDLAAGDEQALKDAMRWLPAAKRPTVGLRWGMGVYWTNQSEQPWFSDLAGLEKLTGALGPGVVSGLQRRIDEGKFGSWPEEGDPRFRQVALLSGGDLDALIDMAGRQGLDAAAFLMLTKKVAPMGRTSDILIRARLVDLSTRETFWASPPLSNNDVLAARQTGRDVAAPFVADVLKKIDDELVLRPMPAMMPEHARGRLAAIAAGFSGSEDALPILVEVRYYQASGLLAASEVMPLYDRILGAGQGRGLAEGDAAKRAELLKTWLEAH